MPAAPAINPPRVLVTRGAHQSSELANHLRTLGLDPILIPTIETTNPTSFTPLDTVLNQLNQFHWLLFTSANAVQAFAERIASLQIDRIALLQNCHLDRSVAEWRDPRISPAEPQTPALPPTLRIAAIGPTTAQALQSHNLTPNLIPAQAIAESLTESLLPHTHQPDGTPTKFLLIRAEEARDHLPETLRAAGAEVTIAPAYRTIIPESSIPTIRDLFTQNPPKAITFTSSSTARNLLALCEAAGVTLPTSALRISIGPITTQTLSELGLPPHAESPQATVAALAETVLKALEAKPHP
jgi:uroporphyrinogen-III synthase